MKKSMLNLGRTLNKTEQKQINGGSFVFTKPGGRCDTTEGLVPTGCVCVPGLCGPTDVCLGGIGNTPGVCTPASQV